MKKDQKAPAVPATEIPARLYEWECKAKARKVGAVWAYRGARVKLTEAQARAINDAFPGSLELLGPVL